jgi:hypothetical protein
MCMSIRNRMHSSATDLDKDSKLVAHAVISPAFKPAKLHVVLCSWK